MSQSEYLSSAKVIFSDRGSIYFGMLIILFMVVLGIGLFVIKFQKNTTTPSNGSKPYPLQDSSSPLLKHPFLFKSTQNKFLLFSFKTNPSTFKSKNEE